MRIAAIHQFAYHVDGGDRSRLIRPGECRPDLDQQATAQIRTFDPFGKLVEAFPLPRVVIIAGQNRAVEQSAQPAIGRRAYPGTEGNGYIQYGHIEWSAER